MTADGYTAGQELGRVRAYGTFGGTIALTGALDGLRAYAAAEQLAYDAAAAALRAVGCDDATIAAYTADAEATPFSSAQWLRYMRRCLEENRAVIVVGRWHSPSARPDRHAQYRAYEVSLRILAPPTLGLHLDVLA